MDPVFRAVVTLGYSGGRRTGKGDHLGTKKKIKKGKKGCSDIFPPPSSCSPGATRKRRRRGEGRRPGARGHKSWMEERQAPLPPAPTRPGQEQLVQKATRKVTWCSMTPLTMGTSLTRLSTSGESSWCWLPRGVRGGLSWFLRAFKSRKLHTLAGSDRGLGRRGNSESHS